MADSKLYIRSAVVNRTFMPEWRWIVWLDENPPTRHWRDGCMEPTASATHVGVFEDWDAAWRAGVIAQKFANVRWRTLAGPSATSRLEVVRP